MRPVCCTVPSAVAGPWIPLDYIESWFGVSLFVTLSEDASGMTYTVDFTGDDTGPVGVRPIKISRSGTVATVTDLGPVASQYKYDNVSRHGLVAADSVVIQSSLGFDGTYAVVTTPTPTSYTITVPNSGVTVDGGNAKVNALRVFNHTVLTAQTVRNFGTFNYPVRAIRLRLSAWTAGQATLCILQGTPR